MVKHLWLCARCASELENGLNLHKVEDSKIKPEAKKGRKCEYCKKALYPDLYKLGVKV